MERAPSPSSDPRRRLRWLLGVLVVVALLSAGAAVFVVEPPEGVPASIWLSRDVQTGDRPYVAATGTERLAHLEVVHVLQDVVVVRPSSAVVRGLHAMGAWIGGLRGEKAAAPVHRVRVLSISAGMTRVASRDEWVSFEELDVRFREREQALQRELDGLGDEFDERWSRSLPSELDRALGWRCGTPAMPGESGWR